MLSMCYSWRLLCWLKSNGSVDLPIHVGCSPSMEDSDSDDSLSLGPRGYVSTDESGSLGPRGHRSGSSGSDSDLGPRGVATPASNCLAKVAFPSLSLQMHPVATEAPVRCSAIVPVVAASEVLGLRCVLDVWIGREFVPTAESWTEVP